jgi:hypothetical protein
MKAKTENRKKPRRQARRAALGAENRPARPPMRFSRMAKPIGTACNLRCRYCFHLGWSRIVFIVLLVGLTIGSSVP